MLSIPDISSTLGFTIPAPKSSSMPVPLHTEQPFPWQDGQETSTSILGSVKGKKDGLNLIVVSSPNNLFIRIVNIDFKSAIETFSSITSPSN